MNGSARTNVALLAAAVVSIVAGYVFLNCGSVTATTSNPDIQTV